MYAEMFRRHSANLGCRSHQLRGRGHAPTQGELAMYPPEFAPRARRCSVYQSEWEREPEVCSAHAEMIPAIRVRQRAAPSPLRVNGDVPATYPDEALRMSSAPRTRRWSVFGLGTEQGDRVRSARAEMLRTAWSSSALPASLLGAREMLR